MFAIFVGALDQDVQKHLLEVMRNNIKSLSNSNLANLGNYLYNANFKTFIDLYFDRLNSLGVEDFVTMISSIGDNEILLCCEKFKDKFEEIPTEPLIVKIGTSVDDPAPMTKEIAQYALDKFGYHFDYLKGRPLKINLDEDIIYVDAYNRDNNGIGLAQKAISSCPNVSKKL